MQIRPHQLPRPQLLTATDVAGDIPKPKKLHRAEEALVALRARRDALLEEQAALNATAPERPSSAYFAIVLRLREIANERREIEGAIKAARQDWAVAQGEYLAAVSAALAPLRRESEEGIASSFAQLLQHWSALDAVCRETQRAAVPARRIQPRHRCGCYSTRL